MTHAHQPEPAHELTCEGCLGEITPEQRCWVQVVLYQLGDTDIGADPVFWHEHCREVRPVRTEIVGVVA